jgi:hypothetical protein
MTISKNNTLYMILILFSLSSFIYGFVIREDSAGGGKFDFLNTWTNQKIFNENTTIASIKNTKTSEIKLSINSHFPSSYIINKFLNPFSKNKENFLISIFILNIFLPIIFFLILKKNYKKQNLYLLACFSSIIYLSPYYRTSSYWAGMENYGLLMMVISYYFYSTYLKEVNNKKKYILIFSIFSCLCVYFDQKLALIPLIYSYLFLKHENNKINISLYIIINFILSLPVFSLIYYWGSLISPHDTISRSFGTLYLEQIGYFFSITSFYLIPYIFIFHKKIFQFVMSNKKYFMILFFLFSVYLILIFLFPTNYFQWEHLGKGWAHKLSRLIFEDEFSQKIFLYFIFFISIFSFFAVAQKRILLIFFVIFFIPISLLILPFFQEYLDPLVFIFLSLFFYNNDELNNRLVKSHYLFSLTFLIFANLYY